MTTKQILQEAKQLLIDKGWTKGMMARDANGVGIYPAHEEATCFCAIGAIEAVATFYLPHERWVAKHSLGMFVPARRPIPAFNDHPFTSKEMVLELFDKAIAEA